MSKKTLDAYFQLMEERPELFEELESYPIVRDRRVLEQYENESERTLGVVYQSPYHLLLVDAIQTQESCFLYERVVPIAKGRGVVCIPVYRDKMILLRQQRHAIRNTQICFPRGFGEQELSGIENAKKELEEEIGAVVGACSCLGCIHADSGLTSGCCDVIRCEVESYLEEATQEGIQEVILMDQAGLEAAIRNNEIDDGFTLSAYALMKARQI